ncbi:Methyltransferase domain-containing protein [Micromonospora pallida]|uniref:Methyltransferase domain-containing protein n=1 Tax=Micromonospora pallida TaxID=145854 RepID=A0A1C6T3L4_9ACTN|nr:class I SAM-dependent methyltransferase [Micromonospora pallida]SCL36005.1 Methyltransferase domain-containing protein [Micromonospora pallida]
MDEPTRRIQAAYDRMAADFAVRNASMPPAYLALADEFRRRLAGAVLDLGCGVGRDLAYWTGQGVPTVGLDLSRSMLDHARGVGSAPLVQGDMLRLPFVGGAFSGVWCSASLLHLSKALAPAALAEMRRVLRPGGPLLVSLQEGAGEGWEHRPGPDDPARFFAHYGSEEAAALLAGAGFTPLRLERDVSPVGQRWQAHLVVRQNVR